VRQHPCGRGRRPCQAPARTNMIVYYDDPEWVVKTAIYNRFGCHKGGY
jgi:hypothetical protein